jgi:hypothetical protein
MLAHQFNAVIVWLNLKALGSRCSHAPAVCHSLLHLLTSALGTTRKRLGARIDSANWGEADSNAAAR